MRFDLTSGREKVQAEDMKGSQKRPEVGCRNEMTFQAAGDVPKNVAVADRGVGNETLCRETSPKLRSVVGRSRTIQQTREML